MAPKRKKQQVLKATDEDSNSCDIIDKKLRLGSNVRLEYKFFDVACKDLAINLLGKVLVRKLDTNELLKGRIVETECYLGINDKASHSYNNRLVSVFEMFSFHQQVVYAIDFPLELSTWIADTIFIG